MNASALFIGGAIVFGAVGLVAWVGLAMAQLEDDLRFFSGFESLHFAIGPQAADGAEGRP